ncbi:MAG TPA: hypothetical protein VGZ69_01470 [Candidatus Rhabdochlamydia sp.]|jgi:hypothetical protein|nr:hypothetical protein [Candidatus Rhabdochlamydia sp.]
MTQIACGALEALVPFGWVINAAFDVVATGFNLNKEIEGLSVYAGCMDGEHAGPHNDVDYPLPFLPLHLV